MKICEICDKKMPDHILEAHMKKSHSEEPKEEVKPKFDWGETETCAACGEEYPAKAMPFHSRVAHGT